MASKKEIELPPVENPEIPDGENPPNAGESETITEAPVKRGRGRPRKDGSNTAPGPKKSKARVAQDTEELGTQIVGLHKLAALVTGLPELEISPIEGQMLAGGINAVCQEYGLSLSGKTGAMVQLIGAMGVVYMPRLVVIKKRMDAEKARADENRTVDMPVTVAAGQPENVTSYN